MKKNKQHKNKAKQASFRFILPVIGFLLLVAALGLFFLFRPRPAWIVEDRYIEAWEKVLAASPSPLRGAKLIPLSGVDSALPRSRYGYMIGSAPEPLGGDESPVRVYRGPAGSAEYAEALLLALDPWLIFRKFTSPPLSREQAENGPGNSGRIFMAGSDQAAVWAWTAQLLQETPGGFPGDRELWERTGDQIFLGGLFQTGARTYSWEELWQHLLGDDETIWVYAPLSRIRKLPVHETNILEADVFPGRPGWNQFGFQTEFLRATPYGSRKNREKLEPAETWLRSAQLQSLFADTLGWLAVHPEASPFNPVSGSARITWLTASYTWEMAFDPKPDQ